MPAEDRIGCKQRPNLFEHLPPENLAIHSQTPALIVIQRHVFLAQLFSQDLVFCP